MSNPAPPYFFKEWRDFRELTQAEVEKAMSWPQGRVSNIENGRAIISDVVLLSLSKLYRCGPGDLLTRKPPVGGQPSPVRPRNGKTQSFAALQDALDAIDRLANEAQRIRSEIGVRLDAFEREIQQAGSGIEHALREGETLAETLQRIAGGLVPDSPINGSAELPPHKPGKPPKS